MIHSRRMIWLAVFAVGTTCLNVFQADAQSAREEVSPSDKDPRITQPLPLLSNLKVDAAVPTLQKVVGYDWGQEISSHPQMQLYLNALSQAVPDRTRLVKYGASYEGRELYYLVIGSAQNLARLEELRQFNLRLAAGTALSDQEREQLGQAPAIVWLAYSVHGNEITSTDSALMTAYHLLADQGEVTRRWLEDVIVVIDPLQNPDGRARFISAFREARGRFLQPEPYSNEHTERWPGGRQNHYWFDMNRDWFCQSQKEVREKVAAYLHWQPHIYVDAHEMGSNSTYYFAPPTDPINPFLLPKQHAWLYRIGRHQAQRFDENGYRFTTREIFDAFYPGYGSEWPTLQGGLGILWEQASPRGLIVDRDDETQLTYRDGVDRHYVSGLATIEVASRHRRQLVTDFHEARRRGVELGQVGPVRDYFLIPGTLRHRTAALAETLQRNGIQVYRTVEPVEVLATDVYSGEKRIRTVPPGSYQVPVAQAAGRIARALLDREVEIDQAFVQRQLNRKKSHLSDEFYDVTAWSMALSYGVSCLASHDESPLLGPLDAPRGSDSVQAWSNAKIAYLIRNTDGAMKALSRWLQSGVRVHVTDKPLTANEQSFDRGTLLILIHENQKNVHQQVRSVTEELELDVVAADQGFVQKGSHFGGPEVRWVKPPRPLLLVDRPTRYSTGHTWYVFDQVLEYPVTRVATSNLGRVDWSKFNVLVIPPGSYSNSTISKSVIDRIRLWVSEGGTLVLSGSATQWAMGEDVELLQAKRVMKQVAASKSEEKVDIAPDRAPGAYFRAKVFQQHWVTYSYDETAAVFYSGDLLLHPLGPTEGRNLVTFEQRDRLLASGFCWDEALDHAAETPYCVYRSIGRGHVIGFVDDPNYRAMYPGLQRLFMNSVMFGPSH